MCLALIYFFVGEIPPNKDLRLVVSITFVDIFEQLLCLEGVNNVQLKGGSENV